MQAGFSPYPTNGSSSFSQTPAMAIISFLRPMGLLYNFSSIRFCNNILIHIFRSSLLFTETPSVTDGRTLCNKTCNMIQTIFTHAH